MRYVNHSGVTVHSRPKATQYDLPPTCKVCVIVDRRLSVLLNRIHVDPGKRSINKIFQELVSSPRRHHGEGMTKTIHVAIDKLLQRIAPVLAKEGSSYECYLPVFFWTSHILNL